MLGDIEHRWLRLNPHLSCSSTFLLQIAPRVGGKQEIKRENNEQLGEVSMEYFKMAS